jgi:hypothetical protein
MQVLYKSSYEPFDFHTIDTSFLKEEECKNFFGVSLEKIQSHGKYFEYPLNFVTDRCVITEDLLPIKE